MGATPLLCISSLVCKRKYTFILVGLSVNSHCFLSAHAGSLRGAFRPTADHPASQYFDSVKRDSVADRAGLKTGDFLLEVSLSFHNFMPIFKEDPTN